MPKLAIAQQSVLEAISPLRLTIAEAARAARTSPAQLYRRLQSGELKAKKDGASTYILPEELKRYVESRDDLQLPDRKIKEMAIETATTRMATRARKRAVAGRA